MPALNFKKEFADLVESGKKTQTIRRPWKRPIYTGDKLYLYTGMRTKSCRKLGEGVCKSVKQITISSDGWVNVDHIEFPASRIAYKDGFNSVEDFIGFFLKRYGLPFRGILIEWRQDEKGGVRG